MTEEDITQDSPSWGATTKLVIGLSFVALVAALLIRFRGIIGPLILAFILAYALHPLADWISARVGLKWRTSVNIVFLVLVILLGGLFTLTGLAVAQQVQSLVRFVQNFVTNLPGLVDDLSTREFIIGPFQFGLAQFDLDTIVNQVLSTVQPLLGQVGGLVGTFATGAAGAFGWGFFILLVAYFVLADSGRWFPDALVSIEIPGHQRDVRRLGRELGRIWNAFLRGQIILFVLTVIAASVTMTALGVRLALGLALLAGMARFVPYVGPFTVWVTTFLVTFFQISNYFNFSPFVYALIVVGAQVILDQIFDNYLSPRMMGQTLGVHPAAVLVSAIIVTNLIGLVGLLLAAPVLATFLLFGRYAVRKMFDLDPWPAYSEEPDAEALSIRDLMNRVVDKWRRLWRRGAEDVEG
jgi:predicted PurR-regulated permease PerM